MATKRLKFLKRVKIRQEDIRIQLDAHGSVKRFRAEIMLNDYSFPADAKVIVEAKQLLEAIRFQLGTVAGLQKASVAYDISRLKGERVTFNVLVLDPSTSRKLGSAETIRPNIGAEGNSAGIPLLPVDASGRVAPLVWEIAYDDHDQEGHTDAPVLRVDAEAARHSATLFMQDSAVRALVLPSAMREVLTKILLIDRSEYEPESRSWRSSWIRLGVRLVGDEPPVSDEPQIVEEQTAWISRATQALARRSELLAIYLRERES